MKRLKLIHFLVVGLLLASQSACSSRVSQRGDDESFAPIEEISEETAVEFSDPETDEVTDDPEELDAETATIDDSSSEAANSSAQMSDEEALARLLIQTFGIMQAAEQQYGASSQRDKTASNVSNYRETDDCCNGEVVLAADSEFYMVETFYGYSIIEVYRGWLREGDYIRGELNNYGLTYVKDNYDDSEAYVFVHEYMLSETAARDWLVYDGYLDE